MKLPAPFDAFKKRIDELRGELFPEGISPESIAAVLSRGRAEEREIFNYLYSLLGPGTLLLRFGAVILLGEYLREIREGGQVNAVLNHTVLQNLKDALPTDTGWRLLFQKAAETVTEETGVIGMLRDFACETAGPGERRTLLEAFVTIRNKTVHQALELAPPALMATLELLERFAGKMLVFDECEFKEEEGRVRFWSAGLNLDLHPFVQGGESPYLFQGIYGSRDDSILRLLGTAEGDETAVPPSEAEEYFHSMRKSSAGLVSRAFDFSEIISNYGECFVGRDEELEALRAFRDSPGETRFLPVYAPAGFGKSALLACFSGFEETRERVLLHLCGGSERSNPMNIVFSLLNHNKNLWNRLSNEIKTRVSRLPGNYDGAIELFQHTLAEYDRNCRGATLVVIIDGVDEAEVAWPNLPLWNLLYVKEKDEEGNESIRPWDIPENIRIIFGYREGTTGRKDIPAASIDILQPMRPLGEGSVDQAFARFGISKTVQNAIIDHGRPYGSREGIDPSYLRFVYNDMLTGRISPENAASVPRGLTGLYMSELGGRARLREAGGDAQGPCLLRAGG